MAAKGNLGYLPMATRTRKVVPQFDFTEAEALSVPHRFQRSLERARELLAANGYQDFSDFPCIPTGASDAELAVLEKRLVGASLPDEYRAFLKTNRYLKIDDGIEIGGVDHEGVYVTESPWVSEQHRAGEKYLVFANYWRYADGDQLMFDLSDPSRPVVVYLHEHGPLFEDYAPSFSLALWRLVHEADGDGE
jgi:hypothetical protein